MCGGAECFTSFCSKYVWIWLLRFVPKVGSFTGRITISLLLASTWLFSPVRRVAAALVRYDGLQYLRLPNDGHLQFCKRASAVRKIA